MSAVRYISEASGMPSILAAGAIGDGITDNTSILQMVIDLYAAQGGGTIHFPAGNYLTGALFLKNNISLHLDAGATLTGSEDPAQYPVIEGRWEGVHQQVHASLINAIGMKNIALLGRGKIDGNGQLWWKKFSNGNLKIARPRLIGFNDCRHILIEDLTLVNSPSWTVNPVHCEDVIIRGITILNPADSPNTDGINPDSCKHVRITECNVSVGDDCITIKAGVEAESPERVAACEDVIVANCTLMNGHGGVVIGSEMSGGVKNVVISNCIFKGTDRGIRLKSRRGRGGVVEDIRICNLIMDDVLCPFTLNMFYGCGAWGNSRVADKNAQPVDDGTPVFRNISFSHITARNVRTAAAFLFGLPEMPAENLVFHDVIISLAETAKAGYAEMAEGLPVMNRSGFFARNIHNLLLDQVQVCNQDGSAYDLAAIERLEMLHCGGDFNPDEKPALQLLNINRARLMGWSTLAGGDGPVLVQVAGERTTKIFLQDDQINGSKFGLNILPEVNKGEVTVGK